MGDKKNRLKEIKEHLIERKLELEQELTRLYQEKFSDDQVQDPGDLALSSTMESLRSSLQDTRLDEYKRIDLALEKIEEGTYGICVDCDQQISEKSFIMRCLVCQEAFEEKKG